MTKKKENPEGFYVITFSKECKEGYIGFCETEEELIEYLRDSFEAADLPVPDIMDAKTFEQALGKYGGMAGDFPWGYTQNIGEDELVIIKGRLMDGTIQLKSKVVLND